MKFSVHVPLSRSSVKCFNRASEPEVCVEKEIAEPGTVKEISAAPSRIALFWFRVMGAEGSAPRQSARRIQDSPGRCRPGESRQADRGVARQGQEAVWLRLRDVSWKNRRWQGRY